MLYLRFTLLEPALYSVHNASQTKIAEVKIHTDGPPDILPCGRLNQAERRSIAAFEP
jgi:hypothetical protein